MNRNDSLSIDNTFDKKKTIDNTRNYDQTVLQKKKRFYDTYIVLYFSYNTFVYKGLFNIH